MIIIIIIIIAAEKEAVLEAGAALMSSGCSAHLLDAHQQPTPLLVLQ